MSSDEIPSSTSSIVLSSNSSLSTNPAQLQEVQSTTTQTERKKSFIDTVVNRDENYWVCLF